METYPTWIRLHPESSDDTLATSVQARIHDPLWLLGRQWQFGELRHDGGATPIDVRVEGTSAPLTRLRGGALDGARRGSCRDQAGADAARNARRARGGAGDRTRQPAPPRREPACTCCACCGLPGLDGRAPFWVERESRSCVPEARSWTTRRASGWRWWSGACPTAPELAAAIRARLAAGAAPRRSPTDEAAVLRAWLTWAGARFEHARKRAVDVGSGAHGVRVLGRGTGRGRRSGADRARVRRGHASSGTTSSRRPARLASPGRRRRGARSASPRRSISPACRTRASGRSRIRRCVSTSLDVLTNPDDRPSPATLMVLDFALSYSDDWFLVPIALDAWSIFEATTVAVTDVFGDVTLAQPPDGRWNMFRLDIDASRAGAVAAVPGRRAGRGQSTVRRSRRCTCFADEVANVAWAVERADAASARPRPRAAGATAGAAARRRRRASTGR